MIYNGKVVGKEASVGIPTAASEEVSNRNILDTDNVKCLALFCRSNPNGYTPELDEECYKALVHSKYRIRPEYTGEGSPAKAESFGKYCGLFIRARVEHWLKYNRFYDIPILNRAAEFLDYIYSLDEVDAFWVGFKSVFPLDAEHIEIDFINEYAFTKFGEVLLNYCQEMYIGLREDVDFVLEALGVDSDDSDDYVECEMVGINPWLNYGDDEDEDEEGCIAF